MVYENEMFHRIETPIGVIVVEYQEYRVHDMVGLQKACHIYIIPKNDHAIYTPEPQEHGRLTPLPLVNWGPDLPASVNILVTRKINRGDHRLAAIKDQQEEEVE